MEYIDLIMDNGELVRIECPDGNADELIEAISNAIRRGDEWSTMMFDGCHADYMGIGIEKINMRRVIGRM